MENKTKERFWKKVDIQRDDECWLWTGGKNKKGYGEFWFPLRGKHTRAHQVSWILKYGDIQDGYCVLHSCDNPSCVNPYHLFLGTNQDNVDDKMKKGRWSSTFLSGVNHPQHGERSKFHKLTETDVLEIRKLKSQGMSLRRIGNKFGVSHGVVNNIIQGRKWAWLK